MLKYLQTGFSGGMQMRQDATRIEKNAYHLGINVRPRFDTLAPVYGPLEIELPEQGNVQGAYNAGPYLLLFINGRAYIRNYNYTNSVFNRVANLQMDENVSRIYAELVPASTVNLQRSLSSSDASGSVQLAGVLAPSKQCVVVQDGINPPWLIDSNGAARRIQSFDEWTADNREYVPIGTLMLHYNGILYVVKGSVIYRSVSGRPLDFVVNIDNAGNKGGDADSTSHRVGYDDITCIKPLNSPDGGFYVSSATFSTRVVPDYEITVFGEPTFDNINLFSTGALNQFCAGDILGDFAFVDFGGITSFNSVAQVQNEGRNSPFHQQIYPLFEGVIQTGPCFGKFDNYALFAVKTIYGDGIAVYDEIAGAWAALDIYSNISGIKQFAEVKTSAYRRLFFITDSKLYEAFAGEEVAGPKVYIGEWTSGDPGVSQKQLMASVVFINTQEDGAVTVTPYVDRERQSDAENTVTLEAPSTSAESPLTPPFGASPEASVVAEKIQLSGCQQGWKTGLWLEWDCYAELSHISLTTAEEEKDAKTQGRRHTEALA